MNFRVLTTSSLLAVSALAFVATPAAAYNFDEGYFDFEMMELVGPDAGDFRVPIASSPSFPGLSSSPSGPSIGLSFGGITQVDVRALHGNNSLIPPDTNGAVGATQYMETTNGAYAVYNKFTGVRTALFTDGSFWTAAGQPPADGTLGTLGFSNGDSRVLYDPSSQKWAVISFGNNLQKIQIAVSDTSDALGTWRSTSFLGFADGYGTGVADYPTLAFDSKAVYIGTNNFSQTTAGCSNGMTFCGTTLNVISRNDIFGAGGPKVTSLKQFVTNDDGTSANDNGYAIQGVNQVGGTDSGQIAAISAVDYGPLGYSISNPGTAGATQSAPIYFDTSPYKSNALAAQPDGTRNIDPLDDRISSTVWEYGGHQYMVHTITKPGETHTSLEYFVIDAATKTVIQKGTIGDGVHDFFQGSIAINSSGQVVVSYNRSGFGADGKVTIFAQQFNQAVSGDGSLVAVGGPLQIFVSLIGNYHNGSTQFADAVGRQRWGDYSQVSVDPTDRLKFWVIGEYALGYLPNPTTSFSRWGTWISSVDIAAVPEPASWAMMLAGFGLMGAAMRRQRRTLTVTA